MNKKMLVLCLGSFVLGGLVIWNVSLSMRFIKMISVGVEIQSRRSIPNGHVARVYSRAGMGDQQLTLEVDGRSVYKSPDLSPGNINESLVWDEDGTVVTLMAEDRILYTYDTLNNIGHETVWEP